MKKYIIPLLLLTMALSLSTISAYYSVMGLVTIFVGGTYGWVILEASKVVLTAFLHHRWKDDIGVIRYWLVLAVILLMMLTSMGIFGQLSKASSKNSENVTVNSSKLIFLEDSISREKDKLDRNIMQIKMYNDSISKLIADDDITKASKERRKIQAEITNINEDNKLISATIDKLSNELLPYKSEVKKHEVEIGPLIYITKLIYGEKEYREHSERTLTYLILLIVILFDPLAISMLIASQKEFNLISESNTEHVEVDEIPEVKPKRVRTPKEPVILDDAIFDDDEILKLNEELRTRKKSRSGNQM